MTWKTKRWEGGGKDPWDQNKIAAVPKQKGNPVRVGSQALREPLGGGRSTQKKLGGEGRT